MDLRYEENIDAFSMNGNQGRQSPTAFKMNNEDNGMHCNVLTLMVVIF